MTSTKKLYVKTYGCQMNVYDSERMTQALGASGYESVSSPEEADMILLNTCHIREKAAEKVYSELGRFKSFKAQKPDLKIGVAGCVAQAEGEEVFARQPMVDLVVGPQSYHRLPQMMEELDRGRRAIDTDFPEEVKFDHLPHAAQKRRAPSAFLTVQEGCDKFCAFCVVPYTRGAESSRPVEKILAEARAMVDQGVREITLLGQNVNAYHGAGPSGTASLADLISALAEITGLERIRYTTSHPNDMRDDLIDAHRDIAKLMPYLHLPVQSGSDKILKAMNRRHDAQSYRALIARIRAARPDLALSGDFIVGFPGETDQDFEDTLTLCKDLAYAQAFSFKYSARPGTPAANRLEVAEEVKAERLARLQAQLTADQRAFQQAQFGKEVEVLIEKPGRKPGQMVGKSAHLLAVHMQAPQDWVGRILRAKVTQVEANSLAAMPV